LGESEALLRRLVVKCRVSKRLLSISLIAGSLVFLIPGGSARGRSTDTSLDSAIKAFNAGKFEDAERMAEAAERANPKRPEIPNLRGAIFTKQKRYDQAEEQFNAALALDPNFYQAKFNLAEVNLRQGKYSEASRRYEEMQKLDPGSELLQFKLILCTLLSGDAAGASTMTDTMKFPGKTPAYYFARAAIAFKIGNKEAAKKYLQNVKKYYSEEQCLYFARSLKDLDLVDSNPAESQKLQGQPGKNFTDEN
jgi:tetratricopeptide (TPR) repeat protein